MFINYFSLCVADKLDSLFFCTWSICSSVLSVQCLACEIVQRIFDPKNI